MIRRVAIMQPYFFPYAGYFRLFSDTDLFIALDNVQFPRRGWVHRNRLLNANGEPAWLTLPLASGPREATIASLEFAAGAGTELERRLRVFPSWHDAAAGSAAVPGLCDCHRPVIDYLLDHLRAVCTRLAIETPLIRASELDIDPGLSGADRLIALAQSVGADTYVNAPGGRALYDEARFARAGLALEFLPDYTGSPLSILQTLLDDRVSTWTEVA